MNPYESRKLLSEYLLFHYGEPAEILSWPSGPVGALGFPARCVSECLNTADFPRGSRALDLGCAVGRSTFELSRHCGDVLGIDFSHSFINAAESLRQTGSLAYERADEGDLATALVARVPSEIDRRRVRFAHGDAMELTHDLGTFDVVLMANLIDRLPAPRHCLRQLPALVRPGGRLVITSPYTWLEEFTPRAEWLGGIERDGLGKTTLEGLRAALDDAFALDSTKELPFLIREHARKFQWSVAQASIWTRRAAYGT